MKQIALIKTGNTIEQIKPLYGDFEDWFADGMGVLDLLQVDVFQQQALPAADSLAGIVVTGSPSMVSTREAWSEQTAAWLAQAVRAGVPVLGVCYGHQLLAHALGGLVGPNPAGRQIGTVSAQRLGAAGEDPLLGHLPATFDVQASHSEAVLELPPGAQRLATSPKDGNFAIRFAENAWGVQFHPEFTGNIMAEYIRCRADALCDEGLNPQLLLDKTADAIEARSVLRKFAQRVLL